MVRLNTYFHWLVMILGVFFPYICFGAVLEISEIDPSSEYIELHNISGAELLVENWGWSELSAGKEKTYDIPPVTLSSDEFLIIEISRKINDGGDTVALYFEEEKRDSIIVPKKVTGKTYQKLLNGWEWQEATKGIKNEENIVEEEAVEVEEEKTDEQEEINDTEDTTIDEEETKNNIATSGNVIFSEILPNPEGIDGNDNEYFEIYNEENFDINISGWFVKDASNKKYNFPDNSIIKKNEYLAVYKSISKITLNNSNESLTLFDAENNQINFLSFSESAPSGKSYSVFEKGNEWTSQISPNAKNIEEINNNNSDEIENTPIPDVSFTLFTPLSQKFSHENIKMQIIRVSPSSTNDFIEIECTQCNENIAGIRLGIDGTAFQIPSNIGIENGNILRFIFDKTGEKKHKIIEVNNNTIFIFYLSGNGLTTGDETITLGDADGNILDAMCYANGNGTFTSREKKEVGQLTLKNQWNGELKEWGCIDSSAFPRNSFFQRKKNAGIFIDTNSKNDFIRTRNKITEEIEEIRREENSNKTKLLFSQIYFSNTLTQLEIENRGESPINIESWYIANKQKWMIDISKTQNFLYPSQKINIQFSSTQAKKYAKENMTLEIRNPSGEIFDVLCINLAKDEKQKKKSIKIISQWNGDNLWKKERKENQCFEYHSAQENHLYSRQKFKKPSFVRQYNLSKNTNNREKISQIVEKKKDEKIESIKKMDEEIKKSDDIKSDIKNISENIRIENITSGLQFSGSVPKGVKKVKISIPKRNFEYEIKVKKNQFSFVLDKHMKKGRYAIDITLIKKNEEIPLPRRRILLSSVLPQELKKIEIAKILPNPQGKDSGNEMVVLMNNSDFSGWARNWSVGVKTEKKTFLKKIPSRFLKAGEKFSLPKYYFPSLRNKNVTFQIYNQWGKVVSEISWTKARNNEYFGILAPPFFEKIKKAKASKKKKKKKTSQKRKSKKYLIKKNTTEKKLKPLKKEVVEGIILKRADNILLISIPEKSKDIFYEIPEYLEYSDSFFEEGHKVSIFIKKGEIKDITPKISSEMKNIFAMGGNEEKNNSNDFKYLFELFIFLAVFGAGGVSSSFIRRKF